MADIVKRLDDCDSPLDVTDMVNLEAVQDSMMTEKQRQTMKECVALYQERLNENPWCKHILNMTTS